MKPEYRLTKVPLRTTTELIPLPPDEGEWELVGPPTVYHPSNSGPFLYFTWWKVEPAPKELNETWEAHRCQCSECDPR